MLSYDEEGNSEPAHAEVPLESNQDVDPTLQSEGVSDKMATFSLAAPFTSTSVDAQGLVADKFRPSVPSADVGMQGIAAQKDIPGPSSSPNASDKGVAVPADMPGPSSVPAAVREILVESFLQLRPTMARGLVLYPCLISPPLSS